MLKNQTTHHRAPRRQISGILLLDKPEGLSSAGALTRVRGIFRAAKGGHTGALDPLASGLLPICLGEAAKFSSFFLEGCKKYVAEGRLGAISSTADREGIIEELGDPKDAWQRLPQVLKQFEGTIEQVPPIYSAIKVGGKPLYAYARKGKSVEIPHRFVEIKSIKLLESSKDSFKVEVTCSKGTYIRTLIADIGAALGCGAYVTSLRRLWVEGLPEGQSISLEQLQLLCDGRENKEDFSALDKLLLPCSLAAASLPKITVSDDMVESLRHGMRQGPDFSKSELPAEGINTQGPVQIVWKNNFLGVGEFRQGFLYTLRMLSPEVILEFMRSAN